MGMWLPVNEHCPMVNPTLPIPHQVKHWVYIQTWVSREHVS